MATIKPFMAYRPCKGMEDKIAEMIVKLHIVKKQAQSIEKQISEIQEFWESDDFLNYIKQTALSKEDFE